MKKSIISATSDQRPATSDQRSEIDYALIETTRPPIYTAMKYWGKKPHNIWSEYIENYTPEDGVFLDPFCGSAVSVIESLKLGRKTIGFDLNPISSFILQVLTSKFDLKTFGNAVQKIIDGVNSNDNYKKIYRYKNQYIHHIKWDGGTMYEIGYIVTNVKGKEEKILRAPNTGDRSAVKFSKSIDLDGLHLYYPNEVFQKSPSFSAAFISAIGGNNFSKIWTERNLFVLSLIFSEIIKSDNPENIKQQLLFGFIQTVHLCTKMNVPRNPDANRPFSTSWGRSAYLCAQRQMEQNPLYVFEGSCFGKQSVESCLTDAKTYFKHPVSLKKVSYSNKRKNDSSFDIKFGAVDVNSIDNYIPEKSIDFIMTDPPYGGLVQYLDLSYIWLVWLKHYDSNFEPDFNAEITVKRGVFEIETYQTRFTGALKKLHTVLKDNGKLVLTFHNKDIAVWNSFLSAIRESGFVIEKSIHQQNMRSGESVVANPYGTSGTDFYIRCIKAKNSQHLISGSSIDIENSILSAAIKVISARNEPTPYQILFNGILAHLSSTGQMIDNFDMTIEAALRQYIGSVFQLTNNTHTTAGDFWWFINPRDYISFPDIPLSDRVEQTVISILRRKSSVAFDEVLKEIFINFPNGLTPDTKSVKKYLEKYAVQSHGMWLYNAQKFEGEFSKHSEYLKKLSKIGKRLGNQVFIGKREQSEKIEGKVLSSYADVLNLKEFDLEATQRARLEMIDMIWFDTNGMNYLIEVENSTTITSAIQRASNADKSIARLIVIPDKREKELRSMKDKFFIDGFNEYGWKYVIYSDIDKILMSKENFDHFLRGLN